ncbi:isopentenyl pyrophosphate isomerase [candidate division MSBL1 archaeon SCGC-AAA259O05]|uniref:Isopentenyl-diphosphate delta-isomerase n=1 Tax=candidate division MSBL1 archaeon SCGC-AAA259O05 TaxID=1698271 RepID=A0A133V451_9EURY|nr:isopentenyl pyrophosphate isomerase [candidate division MSBL1 archaeon SCGC-AAA259O05]
MTDETPERKLDHIKTCLEKDVEARFGTTGFEDIELVHQASPEIDLEEIELSSSFFGKKLDAPVIVSPMTGGHERGREINVNLARGAQELNVGLAVGSQRAGIENPNLEETYKVREEAPDILLLGNLGVPQLNQDYGPEKVEKAIEMIDADGLGLHFNPLQEAIQPEGETNFEGTLEKVSDIISQIKDPIYLKETGAGITASLASEFVRAGAEAIDVSGLGGTSWAGVETVREKSTTRAGEVFWDWGLPTSVSTAEVSETVNIPVISSGGIRSGLDAAKAMALGAELVGVGLPLFRVSVEGQNAVIEWLEEFIQEIRIAMFLTGSRNIEELQETSLIIKGDTRERFVSRGLDLEKYER